MASIGGVSGSNMTSSLYNSANVISGLASGLDTEGMIEGLVQSYQQKIQSLSNKITKTEWKQDAYRSIIAKLNSFGSKYTSFSSNTNLMSLSFFNNAINVASKGANASKVTASGRTDSDVKITSVKQLATSARYSTTGKLKGSDSDFSVTADESVKFSDTFTLGAMSGTMSLKYGGQTVSISFDQSKDIIPRTKKVTNEDGSTSWVSLTDQDRAQMLRDMIEEKLSDTQVTLTSGGSKAANELIDVKLSGGKITFSDKSSGKNSVYIASASDSVKDTLGLDLEKADETKPATIDTSKITSYTKNSTVARQLSGKTMNISLDGKSKTITMPRISGELFVDDNGKVLKDENGRDMKTTGDNFAKLLQKAIDEQFGANKFTVSNVATTVDKDGKTVHDSEALRLKIKAPDNSNMVINTSVGKALGMEDAETNYLNTNSTLGDLMEDNAWVGLSPAKGTVSYDGPVKKDGKLYDLQGRLVNADGNLIDAKGNELYAFKVNGVTIGNYGKDTKLSTILEDLNNNEQAGVRGSYSQTTRQFTFSTKETGVENEIEFDGLARAMFGNTSYVDVDELYTKKATDIYGAGVKGRVINFQVGDTKINYQIQGEGPNMKHILDAINSEFKKQNADYTASYSKDDGSLVITDKNGRRREVTYLNDDTLGKDLFAKTVQKRDDYSKKSETYIKGVDAVFSAEINGQNMVLTRGSNSTSLDGMTVNLKDTFNTDYIVGDDEKKDYHIPAGAKLETEAVSFERTTDSDKIIETVRNMVADFNEVLSEVRSQYNTLPYRKSSNGSFSDYDPLTEEEKATMSESAIQAYEAKAKQGILFGDNNLKGLYDKMVGIFTSGGVDQQQLQQMGLSITYSSVDGSAQLTLDESKLKNALDSDPDAVANAFARTGGNGKTQGIMQAMKGYVDDYAGLTGATKGLLVEQAGTPLSSLSLINNTWQSQMDDISTEIEKWQDKLEAQVDKYTSMFSKLETLIYQMNSQSSTLAGLMGG